MAEFEAVVQPANRGGHYVEVPDDVAAEIGGKHLMRVRGTLAGARYRSNLAKVGGRLILGVHKATLQAAGKDAGDSVEVTMDVDLETREKV